MEGGTVIGGEVQDLFLTPALVLDETTRRATSFAFSNAREL